LNSILTNGKNLIPLWVKRVWHNNSFRFHSPHCYLCILLLCTNSMTTHESHQSSDIR
jgi:hypothetical protein